MLLALAWNGGDLRARPVAARAVLPMTVLSVGDHGSFGRVVFLLPLHASAAPVETRDGDRLILDLPGAGTIVAEAGGDVTRHVHSVATAADRAVLTLDAGSTTRVWRAGRRIIVDVFGAPAVIRPDKLPPVAVAALGTALPADRSDSAVAAVPGGNASPEGTLGRDASGRDASGRDETARDGPARNGSAHGTSAREASARDATAQDAAARHGSARDAVTGNALPHGALRTAPVAAVAASDIPAATVETPPGTPPGTPPDTPPDTAPDRAPDLARDLARDLAPAANDTSGDAALRAERVAGAEDAVLLPFDAQTGAAAFARGGTGHVVFDTSKAIDLAPLKGDPVFGDARITLSPGATQLTMAVAPGNRFSLRRTKRGWVVVLQRGKLPPDTAAVRLRNGRLSIAMANAWGSAVLVDEATGGALLVGTVREHGAGVLVPHASPEFKLLPSWEGAVVAAFSDRISLTQARDGFSLQAGNGKQLAAMVPDDSQIALEQAGALTRRFDIPPLPLAAIVQRLSGDVSAAAAAPKRARFAPRLRAAQAMLALGMGREAEAALNAARTDDPARAAQADSTALLCIARYLAAGAAPQPGRELADPALGGSDEVALWRALAQPLGMPAGERAAMVAGTWRLLLSYPAPLRARLLPAAAAILADGRQTQAARALLDAVAQAGATTPALTLVRAGLSDQAGRNAEALALLDQATASADRKTSAMALRRAIELRLQGGRITPLQASAQLLSQIDRWREPDFEIEARLRAASWLVQAGDFRGGLAAMRATESLFPNSHDRVHAAEQLAMRALVQAGAGATIAPVDLVALVDENADLLGERDVAGSLAPVLVDKLAALDLPDRAEKLVGKLFDSTNDAGARALLGSRLAGLRLDERDAAGAMAALDQSEAADAAPPVADARGVQRARALLLLGHDDAARAILAPLHSVEALTLSAGLLERSREWRAAEAVLQRLVQALVPATGVLSDAQQDLVLRLAGAASQSGDRATLRALQDNSAPRLSPGPRSALFAVLAAPPVQDFADLPRARRETDAARSLPAALASFQAH